MNEATRRRLNAINREFYETTAADFDATRARPWPGWRELTSRLDDLKRPLRVLDVGCGNGRFAGFLRTELGLQGYRYLGVDASAGLLARARARFSDDPAVEFVEADFIADAGAFPVNASGSEAAGFALVALFGVLHHVPGRAARADLVRALAAQVAPGGDFAFSSWRFDRLPRLRSRFIPWDHPRARALGVDRDDLEAGDHLLAWGTGQDAHRYCHLVEEDELMELVAATGLTVAARWSADGATGDVNDYVLVRA